MFGYALCCAVGMRGTEFGLNLVSGVKLVELQATAETLHGPWRTLEKPQFDMPWDREGWSAVFSVHAFHDKRFPLSKLTILARLKSHMLQTGQMVILPEV